MTKETRMGAGAIDRLFIAAEEVKMILGDRNVCVGLSTENRSMEPWCMEAVASDISITQGNCFAFSPLHQRPSSPLGMLGIEVGHLYVGDRCPGLFQGFFHPDGFARMFDWLEENETKVCRFLRDEIGRTEEEIANEDLRQVRGTRALSGEEKGVVLQHLKNYLADVEEWHRKVAEADFGDQDPR
jgi:hypothetical protein